MPESSAADITPDSTIGDLLERWPALEEVLVDVSPHFRALKNPILRRTVAKVATVRQAAAVSGVPLALLVERLRAGAGLAPSAASGGVAEAGGVERGERPAWAFDAAVTRTHDARAAIAADEHPLPQVMADLAALGDGEVYLLVTPFLPAPLVDLARAKGYAAYSVGEGTGEVRTFFRRERR
jgi:uncharacterized protein DUF1858